MPVESAPQSAPNRLVIGRYRLRRLLGAGSMGTVWEAYDEFLHRPVAVKEMRLPPGMPAAEAAELRERTLREARAIAVVSHPNVITLHDVARERDEPFVVMELIRGHSLAQVLRALGALSVPQAAAVADGVAGALQAAHAAGITHRDVKPGNVLVGGDGQIKLTDFGIARNVGERTMTRTGIMLGSPAYISPEVASGREVTPAADLWGLGATLFAAAVGRAPYDPDGEALAIIAAVVDDPVPEPEVDGPLREVITGLMEKDPAARMSLAEVRRTLQPLLAEYDGELFGAEHVARVTEALNADPPTAVVSALSSTPRPAATAGSTGPGALAADPGPLPFATGGSARPAAQSPQQARPSRRTRGPVARALLAALRVAAVLVLAVAAAAGGFAATRTLGGRSVLPPPAASAAEQQNATAPVRDLRVREADASTLSGSQGGGFTVAAPADWVQFVEERQTEGLPNNTRVHFVALDGVSELTIERYPGFYPEHGIDDYLKLLGARWPDGQFRMVSTKPVPATVVRAGSTVAEGPEPAQQVVYRSTELAADLADPSTDDRDVRRTSYANAVPVGTDLWVVSLVVPTDEENRGRELFDRLAGQFTVTG